MFLFRFVAAWRADWTGRMSGLASVGFTVWVTFFTPDATLSKFALIAFAVAAFIWGSYHVWVMEHKALLAERTLPEIKGRIEEDFIHVNATAKRLSITFIPIVVQLVNHRQTEAGIDRFELTVLIDGKEHKARNIPDEGLELMRPEFDRFGLRTNPEGVKERYKDLWKHRREPLKRGAPQYGWLIFVLTDVLIHPSTDCILRLTVVDVLGGTHQLPDTPKTRQRSGNVQIPIDIEVGDLGPITRRASDASINEGLVSFIIEGRALLGECENLTNLTPTKEFQEFKDKVDLWVLNVEDYLRQYRGPKYVILFHADAGVPKPFGPFGESAQAKLCHHLRSRLCSAPLK